MLLYSRTSLSGDLTGKLLHVFVMLESLLLKNETEPIAASLSERVAFLIGRDASERLAIASQVKHAYALRSKFVHHGSTAVDRDVVRSALEFTFNAFFAVVLNRQRFGDREELIAFLERKKFS